MSDRTSHQSPHWRMAWRETMILLRHNHQSEMHPTDTVRLGAEDTLAVPGGPEPFNHLLHDND